MLGISAFLIVGGAYSLLREIFILDTFRLGWAISSTVILAVGLAFYKVANKQLLIRDVYFSMNPDQIKYRLAVFAHEKIIPWGNIKALEISAQMIIYNMTDGKDIKMRLGNIQQPEVMLHVTRSLHLAAIEKGIVVNGVGPSQKAPVV